MLLRNDIERFWYGYVLKRYGTILTKAAEIAFDVEKSTCNSSYIHYNDVIMSAMASQVTSLTIVYSTVYSSRRSKKTSKLRVTGLCAVNSPHKGPVTRKTFPFDDVIMGWHVVITWISRWCHDGWAWQITHIFLQSSRLWWFLFNFGHKITAMKMADETMRNLASINLSYNVGLNM